MASGTRGRKTGDDARAPSQPRDNAGEAQIRQESGQTLAGESEDPDAPHSDKAAATPPPCLDDEIDYAELAARERARTKNLEAKREYLISQERNRRLQEPLRDDEVAPHRQRRRRASNTDEGSPHGAPELKRQRSACDLKPANLDLYYGKSFKEFKDWTRSALNAFEASPSYFPSEWVKISWAQQFLRDTPSQRWGSKKDRNLATIQTTWEWTDFSDFLANLMEDPWNRWLAAAQKHDAARQGQSQSVNDFVAYIEILEADLDEFSSIQQRDHLLNRLRKDVREKLNAVADMPITRETLVALAQRYEGPQPLRTDLGNRIQGDRGPNSSSRTGNRAGLNRRAGGATDRPEQRDRSTNDGRRSGTSRLPLRGPGDSSSGSRDERSCYNYGKNGHIVKDCSELKQENFQVNAVGNSRQSSSGGAQKAPPPRPVTEVSDDSEN
jgi:hypothetical protein